MPEPEPVPDGEGLRPGSGPVEANNLVRLRHLVPVSVWDLDLAAADAYEVRLGRAGEGYVFNAAGQVLDLADLVCGYALRPEGSVPLLTPVKDALASKVREDGRRLGALVYWPPAAGDAGELRAVAEELAGWLATCGPEVVAASACLLPGGEVELALAPAPGSR